jgi:hypothetical protein
MNAGSKKKTDFDEFLRKAFADDLPEDVATGMRRRIEDFRAEKMGSAASAQGGRSPAWAWFFRRSIWAALSILLLVAGIILQGGKSSSALADRISAIKSQYAGLEMPRR